jgi:hypothetical protein
VKSDGPVSYWRLGDTSGTVARDSVDGNPGAILGRVTLGVPGAITGDPDKAMTFDGRTGYISVADHANLNIQGDLTVETWASVNAAALNGLPAALVNKGFYQYQLGIVNNRWRGSVFFAGVLYDVVAPKTIMPGQWYHIAMTRSGTTLTLYVNGVAVATTTAPTGPSDLTSGIMAFGRRSSASADFFNGFLDEIAVYNKALSAAQIAAHYTTGEPNIVRTAPTFIPIRR